MYPLNIKNLNKKFNDKIVLNNINLKLEKNEIFGLIGLNGAGKTTLIKSILNLLKIDSGKIEIFNKNNTFSESRENLKYLPEKFFAPTILKGMEFLKFFNNFNNKSNKIKDDKLEQKIFNLSKLLNFNKEFLNLKISKYSKGMMQKLGLISTFLEDTSKLIILDEPMSGLDPIARVYLKKMLLKSKKENKTVFFSSHILSDIDEICDRIAILYNSKIVFLGTPTEFKKKHKEKSLENAFLKEIS